MTRYSEDDSPTQELSPAPLGIEEDLDSTIASPGAGAGSILVESAEVQASMQSWLTMECYQLSRGTQMAQLDFLDLGSLQIVREFQHASVQKLGATPANLCTISVCTPKPGNRFSEFSAGEAAGVFFMPGNTEFDVYVPEGASSTYVSFDQDEFLQGARALDPAQWEHAPSNLEVFPGAQQASFLDVVGQIWVQAEALSASGVPMDPTTLREIVLQSVLMSTVASSAGNAWPSLNERGRAFDICRKSRAFIAECLARHVVPSIPQICTVTGVSERTLQYAFRRYVGMTPLAYLRVCRLNSVRKVLLAAEAETTVTSVALRYGFLHLGRFAGDYHRLFGELPSKDLTR